MQHRSEESCDAWSWSKLFDFFTFLWAKKIVQNIENREFKTWPSVKDRQISHKEYCNAY